MAAEVVQTSYGCPPQWWMGCPGRIGIEICVGTDRQVDPISRHPLKEISMLKINNRKLEDQIKEILQRTSYASAEEYLIARVTSDHQAVKRGKKLP